MSKVVEYEIVDRVAVITIENPPVNAISHAVRQGICDALARLENDQDAIAAVLICAGRTFIAGADISEFGKPLQSPWLPEVVQRLEDCSKPVVAAIHGVALGGGLEIAMGCHARCADATARFGLPEVKLGLLPGASGTQRLPRLAGIARALELMLSGKQIPAEEAKASGIIDEIISGDLKTGALAYAGKLASENKPLRRLSREPLKPSETANDIFADFRKQIAKTARGFFAPEQIIQAVEAAVALPYRDALKVERELFDQCLASPHSAAQRYLFFAEREAARVPGIGKETPRRACNRIAVIGAGTMGTGITMNFLNAGLPVTLLEQDQATLDRGIDQIRKNYQGNVAKGRINESQLHDRMALITGVTDIDRLSDADLVVEAAYEDMEIKQPLFREMDNVCKPGTVLATNTSTLDINDIAAVTSRPQDVIGMHFFAPANIMPLVEIVRGRDSADEVIASAMDVAKKIDKVGVVVSVCFGFVGNRIFLRYLGQAQMMLMEGVAPERVDQIAFDWGMAMGPHAVTDLSGIDVFYKIIEGWPDKPDNPPIYRLATVLYEMKRYGQKSGAGIYKYDGRIAVPDPEFMEIVQNEARSLGIEQRTITDDEILERLLYPMINEGAKILEEGIAMRPGDIDVIFANGYGFPRYRGGPMFYADSIGLDRILNAIRRYHDRYGTQEWVPAALLEKLVAKDSTFKDWFSQ